MRTISILLFFLVTAFYAQAQVLVRLTVEAGPYQHDNVPVSFELNKATFADEHTLLLQEVKGARRIPVPFQVEPGNPRRIWWILDGRNAPGTRRMFELVQRKSGEMAGGDGDAAVRQVNGNGYSTAQRMKSNGHSAAQRQPGEMVKSNGGLSIPSHASQRMSVADNGAALVLQEGRQQLLQYNYGMVYPPAGVDSMYRRSGFIHPLWAPGGAVLTNIHPKDHWHHVGIWNPWTHTGFEGKETDFWNLQKKQGTVRFAGFLSRTEGPVWCGFRALQDHIALQAGGGEKTALNEVWDVRAYSSGTDSSRRIWDLTSTLSCAGSSPLQLLQYRYGGGFGFRATAAWTAATSQVLTSEGKTRRDADSTRARWIKITGQTPQGRAGILVLCYPDNYDFPQPLRVWPENSERGEIMMNYSPTKMRPWTLTYGHEYTQQYRVMVYSDDITPQEAEAAWNAYAHPPEVKLEKLK